MIIIATTVYDSKVIKLQDDDGTEVTLAPLPIARLRRFMKAWAKFEELEEDADALDIYINCCGIALEKSLASKVEKTRDEEKFLTDEYREYLEDILEMDTIFEILDICGGLKLNDPKVVAAAQEAALKAQAAGKN